MMKTRALFGLLATMLGAGGAQAAWFNGNDALTSAHQRLLNGKTAASVEAMIEAWQQPNLSAAKQDHLAQLLALAITEDCGRSLSQKTLPDWLSNISVRRETVQTTSRVYYRLQVSGESQTGVNALTLKKWPDQTVMRGEFSPAQQHGWRLIKDGLSDPISQGLYQLTAESVSGHTWSSWLLLTQPQPRQTLSWKDTRSWHIAPFDDFNSTCQRPFLSLNLYPHNQPDGAPIWSAEKHKRLPTQLPMLDVPNGQYWFSVALIERRWQGALSIEEVQRIGRAIDLPDLDPDALNRIAPSRSDKQSDE
ncbi:hypothetical protein BZG79_03990 [Salinivibrio sp. MA427]|jgi:Protein of unknown function (DUF2861).|uniref:DUF2861 family protein n=2 Tax=Vibrionaceae TaxID=641 RepID=UPI000989229B|nr:DUF2861 family protein [Salinivibrio sp. IB643]OOF00135.1 hypothetical protein BZG77_01475 [Salinivibrio sp. IB643]OOF17757.1 hypothetical protein BZG79_03990 [Salinivibrio sp. MA427]